MEHTSYILSNSDIALEAVKEHMAQQDVKELTAFLDYTAKINPSKIIEIGFGDGGMCWAFSKAFPKAKIIEVTIFRNWKETILVNVLRLLPKAALRKTLPFVKKHFLGCYGYLYIICELGKQVEFIFGDSTKDKTLQKCRNALNSKADVLFIDGDHSYETTYSDLLRYSPLVKKGGLVALHDLRDPIYGVSRAWNKINNPLKKEFCSFDNEFGIGVIKK